MPYSLLHTVPATLGQPLPPLKISTRHTTSHALHEIDFIGNIQEWLGFEADILLSMNNRQWRQRIIKAVRIGHDAINAPEIEHVFIADEHGLQSRLTERLGQVVGAAFKYELIDLHFGGYKGANPPYQGYRKVPDFVVMTRSSAPKLIGEAKAPWVKEHDIANALAQFQAGFESGFRHLLGQVADYMRDTHLKYAFLTTYDQTMFFRKKDKNRVWTLQYSPVIFHTDTGRTAQSAVRRTVSLCECFWHVALLAQEDSDFRVSSGRRNRRWTRRRTSDV